jgi:hypothetical protein
MKNEMVDYARLYDMSQIEIDLFYKKEEEELIEMIGGMFNKEIGRLRSLLINVRKRKTEIKALRTSLENPVEYFENLMNNIYSESEGNIKSLKVTMKKIKAIGNVLLKPQFDFKNKTDTPIGKVLGEQVGFLKSRLDYYENAMEKYQSYIEYSKKYKLLKKKDPEAFKQSANQYCENLTQSIEIEEVALKYDEEIYRSELDKWRDGRAIFQDQYEKQITKLME